MASTDSIASDKSTADLYAMVDAARRRPVTEARKLREIALKGLDAQRAYLRETGSSYADSADLLVVTAAFNGHVLECMSALADRYEHEITRNAELTAQQSVAHAKLYDLEAQLNA